MSSESGDAATPRWPNWLGLVVEDLEEQRRFYREILGLEELDAGEDWVQFDMGGPNLFELLRRSDQPEYDRCRFQPGFAVDDIEAARERLLARGVEAVTETEGGVDSGGYWCYFRDPEGNVFEVSQRLDGSGTRGEPSP
jgi:predicted enzyme related to lactoylglutathione lyase